MLEFIKQFPSDDFLAQTHNDEEYYIRYCDVCEDYQLYFVRRKTKEKEFLCMRKDINEIIDIAHYSYALSILDGEPFDIFVILKDKSVYKEHFVENPGTQYFLYEINGKFEVYTLKKFTTLLRDNGKLYNPFSDELIKDYPVLSHISKFLQENYKKEDHADFS